MSDYSKITNFLSKDSLTLNDPAKYVKGSEIDAEFNAIAVAVATKADTASPTLTTPTLGVASATSINKVVITAPASVATLTIANNKTLTVNGNTTLNTGISDTATAVALSLSGSGANSVTIANSATNPTLGTTGGSLAISSNIVMAGSNIGTLLSTATTAGGASNPALYMGSANLGIYWGSGLPTISAAKGSIYLRSDGSGVSDRMYVATNSAGAWTALTTAA